MQTTIIKDKNKMVEITLEPDTDVAVITLPEDPIEANVDDMKSIRVAINEAIKLMGG